jgi:hypothetical protein
MNIDYLVNIHSTQQILICSAPGIVAVITIMAYLVLFNWRRRQVKPTYSLKALDVPWW